MKRKFYIEFRKTMDGETYNGAAVWTKFEAEELCTMVNFLMPDMYNQAVPIEGEENNDE